MKTVLIIDGGTTKLRLCALDPTGRLLADVKTCCGADGTSDYRFFLKKSIEELLLKIGATAEDVLTCIAFGMITSDLGLCEVKHILAPADREKLFRGIRTEFFPDVAPFPFRLIPGVKNHGEKVGLSDISGSDMMRGEETEAVGLYSLLGLSGDALFVLPGTHNKFVKMGKGGSVQACMTSMSGELLSSVTLHTVAGKAVGGEFCTPENYDREYALAGAGECISAGLGRAAFSARLLRNLGGLPKEKLQSLLLGAVMAEDVKALLSFAPSLSDMTVYAAGREPLCRAFCDVLSLSGVSCKAVERSVCSKMGVTGAWLIGNPQESVHCR